MISTFSMRGDAVMFANCKMGISPIEAQGGEGKLNLGTSPMKAERGERQSQPWSDLNCD